MKTRRLRREAPAPGVIAVFDLVLPRILTGEPVGSAELAELGHGGFLTLDMAFRFPTYRPALGRGEIPAGA
jgi:hypothetical protein